MKKSSRAVSITLAPSIEVGQTPRNTLFIANARNVYFLYSGHLHPMTPILNRRQHRRFCIYQSCLVTGRLVPATVVPPPHCTGPRRRPTGHDGPTEATTSRGRSFRNHRPLPPHLQPTPSPHIHCRREITSTHTHTSQGHEHMASRVRISVRDTIYRTAYGDGK